MTNMLQDGATWLGGQLRDSAGRTVTVQQGSTILSVDPSGNALAGIMSGHEHEILDDNGFQIKVLSYDWTFLATDLGSLELREGAIIRETLSGTVYEYEAMQFGHMPAVERLDSSGLLVLVHTKQVSIVT